MQVLVKKPHIKIDIKGKMNLPEHRLYTPFLF